MTGRQALIELYGTDEPVPEARLLMAGRLSAEFVGGGLRAIRIDGVETLRAISYVVRDRDWGTYSPELDDLRIAQEEGSFSVSYRATCRSETGTVLRYDATIRGTTEGHLRFDVTTCPDGDFETNRCGFSVLHPIVGLAGRAVEVEHSDGAIERSMFPDLIDPYQPFRDIRAIAHEVSPGLKAVCRLDGDVFEMEDQRNWSDASYKTYVRPLALPWPYLLPAGEAFRQSVTLSLVGSGGAPRVASRVAPVEISIGGPIGLLPRFGLVVTPEDSADVAAQIEHLAEIAPQTLLYHLDPGAGHGREALAAYAQLAALWPAEAVLEYVASCGGDLDEEFAALVRMVREAGLAYDAIVVSPAVDRQSTPPGSKWPDCPPLEAVYAAARRAFPSTRLGGGTLAYFTELNRKHPPVELLDFVTHCTCPIVHAADDLSVMQTLEALPFITRSARAIIGAAKPYRIGPSTIGMRHNPYGARTMPNPEQRRIPMALDDPRRRGRFAASWMVGYATCLADADVETFTGGALTGPLGLLDHGASTPAFRAACLLAALGGRPRLRCLSERSGEVACLAGRLRDGWAVALAANLTDRVQTVRVAGDVEWVAHGLNGDIAPSGKDGGVELEPYAVLRFDAPEGF